MILLWPNSQILLMKDTCLAKSIRISYCFERLALSHSDSCSLRGWPAYGENQPIVKSLTKWHTLWLCQNSYGQLPFIVFFPKEMAIFNSHANQRVMGMNKTRINLWKWNDDHEKIISTWPWHTYFPIIHGKCRHIPAIFPTCCWWYKSLSIPSLWNMIMETNKCGKQDAQKPTISNTNPHKRTYPLVMSK